MIGKKILYSGRVQGVGFRYECKRIAMGFEVNGTVENLDDGSVKLCVVGDELEVQDFLKEILINSFQIKYLSTINVNSCLILN